MLSWNQSPCVLLLIQSFILLLFFLNIYQLKLRVGEIEHSAAFVLVGLLQHTGYGQRESMSRSLKRKGRLEGN